MSKVHIYGAAGYAAAETIAILSKHPFVELGALESASSAGEPVGKQFPRLRKIQRSFDPPGSVSQALQSGDIVIMAGAHGVARDVAPGFLEKGGRVIDLSADFRLSKDAVYGFPERYRDQIAKARLIANPGCYPTATLLAALPLSTMQFTQIIVDAKSGITGAGRTPALGSMFAEVSGDIRAYGLSGHRHEPEMLQELQATGFNAHLIFTPHVVPLSRGMLADVYCIAESPLDVRAIRAVFERTYAGNPFVRVLADGAAPSVAAVVETNDVEISVSVHGSVVRSICAIDNLGRGAAGQAVMNLNLMLGYPEETALDANAIAD